MSAVAQVAKPSQWWKVYKGDKEFRFFKEIARGAQEWRTTAGLASKASLKVSEVEAIIARYIGTGIIQQHSKEPDKWRYFERATVKTKAADSIAKTDQKKRVDGAKKSP